MVKFILVIITIVFVGLAYYANIGKDESNVKPAVKTKESTLPVEQPLKAEVKKSVKVLPQSKEVKTEEISSKNSIARHSKIVAQEQTHEKEEETSKEKSGIDTIIVDSLSNPIEYPPLPSEDEMVKMMTEDLKSENK